MTRSTIYSAAILLVGLLLDRPLQAQPFLSGHESSTVTGTGSESIKSAPNVLRLNMEMTAKGKTLAEALAKLKTLRETATVELGKMDVDKNSVAFKDLHSISGVSDRQRQMEQMMQQRSRQGRGRGRKPPEKPLAVAVNLTAEWQLKGKTEEEILLEARSIEDKVRAANLAGKGTDEMTPEEEEMAAEMEAEMSMYDDGQPKSGEPYFLYVRKIDDEQRTKAMAAAFAKAKQQADRLCKAAGTQLGPLVGLSEHVSEFSGMNSSFGNRNNEMARYYMMQMQSERGERATGSNEAIGVQPGEVSMQINVAATFQLGKDAK